MKNFLIVGTQRTGSSAIAEALSFHPMISCGWEWTQDVLWHRKLSVAKRALTGYFEVLSEKDRAHMVKTFNPKGKWLGFRRLFRASNKWIIHPRFSPALWMDRFEEHLKWIAMRDDIHIIHVVRNNNLAWLRSKFMSRKTNLYVGKRYPEGVKIYVPVKDAVARVRSKKWVDDRLASLAATNPYLCINYEQFVMNEPDVVAQAFHLLGCEWNGSVRGEHKVTPQSVCSVNEQVANYDDLVLALQRENLLESA